MAQCFCGCGRTMKGTRLRAANKTADRMRLDVALLAGGVRDRLIAPDLVDDADRLASEGGARLEWLAAYLHGQAERRDLDKDGIGKWMSQMAPHRAKVGVGVAGLGFHGGGLGLSDLLYSGRRASGFITQLRDTGTTVNQQPRVEVTLEVHPEGDAAFVTTTKMLLSRVDPPRVGDSVEVAFRDDDRSDFAFRRVHASPS